MRMIFQMKCHLICRVRVCPNFAMEIAVKSGTDTRAPGKMDREAQAMHSRQVHSGRCKQKSIKCKRTESGIETLWPRL